jgi:ketosteroid isomerase-like protein
MSDDEAAIRRILEDRQHALRAKDAEALVGHDAPDILSYDLAPPLANRGADLAAIRRWFDTWVGPIDLDLQELRIDVADGLAVSTGLSRMRGTKTDGVKVDLWVRATMAYRKVDDRWTVIHEHVSVPFYMDGSERAALDLRPEAREDQE